MFIIIVRSYAHLYNFTIEGKKKKHPGGAKKDPLA